jgi:hypothetical protein
MPKLLKTLTNNLFFAYACFLFGFVILYPKLPLFDLIPGYIVRVRIEDFLILFAVIYLLIINIKNRFIDINTPLTKIIFVYLIIGFLSMLSALIITKTVFWEPLHSGKMFIHWVRRIEYFSVFFIFYQAVKNLKQIRILTIIFFIVLLGVNIYGFGQKYDQWAVYSTMNREFSKGWQLVLTEHARVNSTFGGHYDLAAYLVVGLLLSVSMLFAFKNRLLKLIFLGIFISSIYLMILTASRTSFIAYIAGLVLLLIIWTLKQRNVFWSVSRGLMVLCLSFFIFFSFGELSTRFSQIMGIKQFGTLIGFIKEPLRINVPAHLSLDEELALVATDSDVPPKIVKKQELPPDVYKDIPEKVITTYTTDKYGVTTSTSSAIQRRYSDAAFQVGLSGAIRLDALWPRALKAFKINPLLGTGYSTLTKETIAQFTEAESTDNDYLRSLGETGILGLISFFSIIGYSIYLIVKKIVATRDPVNFGIFSAFIAGTLGLLINALYIDVFEASKVAFIFWSLTAIVLRLVELDKSRNNRTIEQ